MKKLGQNFLINQTIVEKEVDYADICEDDIVLEIGAGRGILTKALAGRAQKVIAVEIDSFLANELVLMMPDNVVVINDDILDVDLGSLACFNKIVSNLPFQISSPITFRLVEYPFKKAVLIYQKDFAQRMIAQVGSKNYCRLSVGVYYKTFCRILDDVSRTCFYPVPKVDSCIVELIPREKPPFDVVDEVFFFTLVKKLFMHRRKKIKNTLSSLYGLVNNVPFLSNRIEELSPEQIGTLSNILLKKYGLF
ncbi:MAG: 16S rRNA (adenine(1518)-N(6)/adenine(1519)-N(6))-dimethyltransferase RsmA [Thermoplasmatota archaeon]